MKRGGKPRRGGENGLTSLTNSWTAPYLSKEATDFANVARSRRKVPVTALPEPSPCYVRHIEDRVTVCARRYEHVLAHAVIVATIDKQ